MVTKQNPIQKLSTMKMLRAFVFLHLCQSPFEARVATGEMVYDCYTCGVSIPFRGASCNGELYVLPRRRECVNPLSRRELQRSRAFTFDLHHIGVNPLSRRELQPHDHKDHAKAVCQSPFEARVATVSFKRHAVHSVVSIPFRGASCNCKHTNVIINYIVSIPFRGASCNMLIKYLGAITQVSIPFRGASCNRRRRRSAQAVCVNPLSRRELQLPA